MTTLEIRLRDLEVEFKTAAAAAELALQAKIAAKAAKKLTITKAPPKARVRDICCGTHVSMFFKWTELGDWKKPEGKCEAKKIGTDDEGRWCNETVKNITQNKYKKCVYACVFDTPDRPTV